MLVGRPKTEDVDEARLALRILCLEQLNLIGDEVQEAFRKKLCKVGFMGIFDEELFEQ